MQRWDIKNHWLPMDPEPTNMPVGGEIDATFFVPYQREAFAKAWAEAELLANDGWELVSVAPSETGYMATWVPTPNDALMIDHAQLGQSYGAGCSYTSGYLLVFKRPRP